MLSPILFAIYVDNLWYGRFVFIYADDIILLAPSITELERLLHACERELEWLDMSINYKKLECGPMPKVMVALPKIGGALCSTPQSLADAHY